MNVLQMIPTLDIGGVETGTVNLARYLVEHGHKAVVISGGGRLADELSAIGGRHYQLPVGRKSLLNVIKIIREVRCVIRREQIDVVHARSRVPAWIGFFASKLERRSFITTAHGYYKKHFLSDVMGWGKFVVVASNIMAKHMVHDFGVPYERIRIIPRGVDINRYHFKDPANKASGEFTVGIVSRITPLKGHADFLRAVSILNRSIPRLRAVVVGDVPKGKQRYKEELRLLTRQLGIGRIVEFMGMQGDIPGVLSELDVLVSTTVTPEAFGRSIIEAQARGVPVVSTRVGGVVDIIEDGKNGLFSEPQDPKAMAENILKIYRDDKLRKALVYNGRKNVEENFTNERMCAATLKVYEEAVRSLDILVIKTSSIGDCVLSVPSFKAIRSKFKDAKIKLLTGLKSLDVFRNCPYIDEVIICDFKKRHRGLKGFAALARDLMKCHFDIVVDLQNNKASHILAFSTLSANRYGYDNGKLSFLLNKKVKDDGLPRDPIEHQLQTLKMLGIDSVSKNLELFPSRGNDEWAEEFLRYHWVKPSQRLVGINLRASSRWLTKNWPAEYFVELCDRLARTFNARIVVTGSRVDTEFADDFYKLSNFKPIIATGKTTLLELASLMRHFDVYLTPDSAPMHIAASMGVPVVALFGPTDPARHFVSSGRFVLINKGLRCSPCYNPRCITNDLRCMRAITVDEVFDAIKRLIGASKSKGNIS